MADGNALQPIHTFDAQARAQRHATAFNQFVRLVQEDVNLPHAASLARLRSGLRRPHLSMAQLMAPANYSAAQPIANDPQLRAALQEFQHYYALYRTVFDAEYTRWEKPSQRDVEGYRRERQETVQRLYELGTKAEATLGVFTQLAASAMNALERGSHELLRDSRRAPSYPLDHGRAGQAVRCSPLDYISPRFLEENRNWTAMVDSDERLETRIFSILKNPEIDYASERSGLARQAKNLDKISDSELLTLMNKDLCGRYAAFDILYRENLPPPREKAIRDYMAAPVNAMQRDRAYYLLIMEAAAHHAASELHAMRCEEGPAVNAAERFPAYFAEAKNMFHDVAGTEIRSPHYQEKIVRDLDWLEREAVRQYETHRAESERGSAHRR